MITSVSLLPEIQYRVQGAKLSFEMQGLISEVIVNRTVSEPSCCELVFHGFPDELNDIAETLSPQNTLEVESLSDRVLFFAGKITEQKYKIFSPQEARLKIYAFDALEEMKESQSVRSHVQVTVRDIAQNIASEHGLTLNMQESGPMRQRVIQYQQSDFDFLLEHTSYAGLYFQVDGTELQLFSLNGHEATLEYVLGENLHEADFKLNRSVFRKGVKTVARNALNQEKQNTDAGMERIGRKVFTSAVDNSELILANQIVENESEAEARTQAVYDYAKSEEIVFEGIVEGNASLKPGMPICLKKVAKSFEGTYILAKVRHSINLREGFVSKVSTELKKPRQPSRSASITIANVINLDDPDGLGRIQVSLPAFGDSETSWMGVVVPGAGKNKGLIALPDIGDQVLVVFPEEDPAQGIILGGLFGTKGMPGTGIEVNNVKRYTFITPGGQKIQLDDVKEQVRIENNNGSYYEMTPGKATIHAETELMIEAPGRGITIKGSSIDFKRG